MNPPCMAQSYTYKWWKWGTALLRHQPCFKIKEKEKQHAQLLAILGEAGHTVGYNPITLRTTGTTRQETLTTLQQLGLTLPHALTTMNKLHQNAISSASNIIRARRIRECQPGLEGTP
jgi:hypothetical protein